MASTGRALVILGAGGHARVLASTARAAGWGPISFFDPVWPNMKQAGDWVVESDGHDLSIVRGRSVVVGIGNNARRLALLDELSGAGLDVVSIVHPTAWICPSVSVGAGTVVFAQAAVNNGGVLGRGVIVNTGAIIDHDAKIGDGVHLSPGAVLAGNVTVGRRAWIATGASVRDGVAIGEDAMIGVGAAVICDVPQGETYVGVPAKAQTPRS